MAKIIHESVQQIVIDIEDYTDEDLKEMSNDEILGLAERIYQHGSDEGTYNIHLKEVVEVLNDDEESIRLIEKDYE